MRLSAPCFVTKSHMTPSLSLSLQANTAWAFSKIGYFDVSLLNAIADQAVTIFEVSAWSP